MPQMNPAVHEVDSAQFCQCISNQLLCGFGVVPFVGSGASAKSGILMGMDFGNYLAVCLHRVIANRMDIRGQGWPAYPDRAQIQEAYRWFLSQYMESCRRVEVDVKVPATLGQITGFSIDGTAIPLDHARALARPMTPQILSNESTRPFDTALAASLRLHNLTSESVLNHLNISKSSTEYIVDFAIRHSYDWRAALTALARVRVEASSLRLDAEPDPSIFDSFHAHITSNRQPNLTHKLIAHLSRPLRSRVILTTNFDELTEAAFERISRPLKVLSVQKKGKFPSLPIVRSFDCIIKLHGTLIDTRADASLDEMPEERELKTFSAIVNGHPSLSSDADASYRSCHLLVVGYSGTDIRCIEFIKHALRSEPKAKVFWICYSDSDVRQLRTVFNEPALGQKRIIFCRSPRPDLLLYELYQRLTHTLPSGGFSYQYSAKLPANLSTELKRDAKRERKSDMAAALADRIFRGIEKRSKGQAFSDATYLDENSREYEVRRVKYVAQRGICRIDDSSTSAINLVRHYSGSLEAIGSLMEHCAAKLWKKTYFVELQDHSDAYSALRDVLLGLSLEAGVFQTEFVNLLPKFREEDQEGFAHLEAITDHIKTLLPQLRLKPEEWVIVVYARSGYGRNSSWFESVGTWNNPDEFKRLWTWLQALSNIDFQIVVFPLDESRIESEEIKNGLLDQFVNDANARNRPENAFPGRVFRKDERTHETLDGIFPFSKESTDQVLSASREIEVFEPAEVQSTTGFGDMLTNVYAKFVEPFVKRPLNLDARERLSFLYTCTLFRQSRHLSAFSSEAMLGCREYFNNERFDNDLDRFFKCEGYLRELCEAGVFLEKPGAFYWLHRDVRMGIQQMIESVDIGGITEWGISKLRRPRKAYPRWYLKLEDKRSSFHRVIGDWYRQAFTTNGHFVPLVEALHHYAMAAITAMHASPGSDSRHRLDDHDESVVDYRRMLFHSAAVEMVKTLELGRNYILFWLADSCGFPMFRKDHLEALESNLRRASRDLEPNPNGPLSQVVDHLLATCRNIQNDIVDERNVESGHNVPLGAFTATIQSPLRETTERREYQAVQRTPDGMVENPEWSQGWRDYLNRVMKLSAWPDNDTATSIILDTLGERSGPIKPSELSRLKTAIRTHRSKSAAYLLDKPFDLFLVTESVTEFSYYCMKRAKHILDRNKRELSTIVGGGYDNEATRMFVASTVATNTGLSYCRNMDPLFLQRELLLRTKLCTIYGLALGYLGRHCEAHRRLTEAHRFLAKLFPGRVDRVQHAIIRLRRAEVFCLQAQHLFDELTQREESKFGESNPAQHSLKMCLEQPDRSMAVFRLMAAHLDDATSMLENAESQLAGHSQHALWWGRLYTLRLQVSAMISKCLRLRLAIRNECPSIPLPEIRYLAQRRPVNHTLEAMAALEKGLLSTAHSTSRQLRLIEHFLVSRLCSPDMSGSRNADFERIRRHLQSLKDKLPRTHSLDPYFGQLEQMSVKPGGTELEPIFAQFAERAATLLR